MALLEAGTPAALAALLTTYGHTTKAHMATLAPGPLATWEEAVTDHGATDMDKDHTQ